MHRAGYWAMVALFVSATGSTAWAQNKRDKPPKPPAAAVKPAVPPPAALASPETSGPATSAKPAAKKKPKVFDFTQFNITGSLRMPQLLYFLGRVRTELDRAALEKRSFMPELDRSLDEGEL